MFTKLEKRVTVYTIVFIMTYTPYTKYEFNDISDYTFPGGMTQLWLSVFSV